MVRAGCKSPALIFFVLKMVNKTVPYSSVNTNFHEVKIHHICALCCRLKNGIEIHMIDVLKKVKKHLFNISGRRGHVLSTCSWRKWRSRSRNGTMVKEFTTYCVLCGKTATAISHPELRGEYISGELYTDNCPAGSAKPIHPRSFHMFYDTGTIQNHESRVATVKANLRKRLDIPEHFEFRN